MVRLMKKINVEVPTDEVEHKLKMQEIKKNSSSDVLHTIKKIKQKENKVVAILTITILCVLCVFGYFIFSAIQDTDVEKNVSGPLVIEFSNDYDGMSDIINFSEEDSNAEIFTTEFTITNNSGSNSWYVVYLDDYLDMIKYDDCMDISIDKNEISFSIDGSETKSLAEVYDEGKYVLMQGIVESNDKNKHKLQVWYSNDNTGHYHGKINVEYIR